MVTLMPPMCESYRPEALIRTCLERPTCMVLPCYRRRSSAKLGLYPTRHWSYEWRVMKLAVV